MKKFNPILIFLLVSSFSLSLWAKPAPSFTLTDWQGKNVKSADLLGKGPVVVNFWATWCLPCLAEMKKLKEIKSEFAAHNLQVVSISIDDAKTAAKVPGVVRQRKFQEFTVLLDPQKEIHDRFLVTNVPELFLLSKEGEIISHHKGFKAGDEQKLAAEIQELLGIK